MWNAVSVAVAAMCIQWLRPATRVTDSSKCATPAAATASLTASFAGAIARSHASVTQPVETSIPAMSASTSTIRPTGMWCCADRYAASAVTFGP